LCRIRKYLTSPAARFCNLKGQWSLRGRTVKPDRLRICFVDCADRLIETTLPKRSNYLAYSEGAKDRDNRYQKKLICSENVRASDRKRNPKQYRAQYNRYPLNHIHINRHRVRPQHHPRLCYDAQRLGIFASVRFEDKLRCK